MERIRNYYNEKYEQADVYPAEPAPFIKGILRYKKEGTVLDLGAGQGRNAVFLAEQGFKVKAVDASDVGLSHLKEKAAAAGVEVETEIGDVGAIEIGSFDVIVSTYVLHNLPAASGHILMEKIKAATNAEGLNVISAFTTEGDLPANPEAQGFYFQPGELERLYSDWEVLEYREAKKDLVWKSAEGKHLSNTVAIIIARKP